MFLNCCKVLHVGVTCINYTRHRPITNIIAWPIDISRPISEFELSHL